MDLEVGPVLLDIPGLEPGLLETSLGVSLALHGGVKCKLRAIGGFEGGHGGDKSSLGSTQEDDVSHLEASTSICTITGGSVTIKFEVAF